MIKKLQDFWANHGETVAIMSLIVGFAIVLMAILFLAKPDPSEVIRVQCSQFCEGKASMHFEVREDSFSCSCNEQ